MSTTPLQDNVISHQRQRRKVSRFSSACEVVDKSDNCAPPPLSRDEIFRRLHLRGVGDRLRREVEKRLAEKEHALSKEIDDEARRVYEANYSCDEPAPDSREAFEFVRSKLKAGTLPERFAEESKLVLAKDNFLENTLRPEIAEIRREHYNQWLIQKTNTGNHPDKDRITSARQTSAKEPQIFNPKGSLSSRIEPNRSLANKDRSSIANAATNRAGSGTNKKQSSGPSINDFLSGLGISSGAKCKEATEARKHVPKKTTTATKSQKSNKESYALTEISSKRALSNSARNVTSALKIDTDATTKLPSVKAMEEGEDSVRRKQLQVPDIKRTDIDGETSQLTEFREKPDDTCLETRDTRQNSSKQQRIPERVGDNDTGSTCLELTNSEKAVMSSRDAASNSSPSVSRSTSRLGNLQDHALQYRSTSELKTVENAQDTKLLITCNQSVKIVENIPGSAITANTNEESCPPNSPLEESLCIGKSEIKSLLENGSDRSDKPNCVGENDKTLLQRNIAKSDSPIGQRHILPAVDASPDSNSTCNVQHNKKLILKEEQRRKPHVGADVRDDKTSTVEVAGQNDSVDEPDFVKKEGESGYPNVCKGSQPPAKSELADRSADSQTKQLTMNVELLNSVREALHVIESMPEAFAFLNPVDSSCPGCETYYDEIAEPMDLSSISKKLETFGNSQCQYKTLAEVVRDVNLIWSNCFQFNPNGDLICDFARKCKMRFDLLMEKYIASDDCSGEPRKSRRSTKGIGRCRFMDELLLQGGQEISGHANRRGKKRRKDCGEQCELGMSSDGTELVEDCQKNDKHVTVDVKSRSNVQVPVAERPKDSLVGRRLHVFTGLDFPGMNKEVVRWYTCEVKSYHAANNTYDLFWLLPGKLSSGISLSAGSDYAIYKIAK